MKDIKLSKKLLLIVFLCLFVLCIGNSYAADFYKEVNMIGGYSDKNEWIGERGKGLKNSVGFEYYKKFSNDYGDFLTTDVQMRVSYDTQEDQGEAWGVELHNAWVEYKLDLGYTVRAGHFDPAFGLEPLIDTHGSLLQTLAGHNVGFKKDWGLSHKGILGSFDYELSATLGSGMSVRHKDDSYLLAGRIGNPQSEDFRYGMSLLYGKTLMSKQVRTIPVPNLVSEETVRRERIGFDVQYRYGSFDIKGEVALGENNGRLAGGGLAEIDMTIPDYQKVQFKLQGIYWEDEWREHDKRDVTLASVVSYQMLPSVAIRVGYFHDIYAVSGGEDKQVLLQLYFFG